MARRNEAEIRFKAETKDFNASMRELTNENKKVRQEMKLQSEQMKQTGTETDRLEATLSGLQRQYENSQRGVEATRQQLERAKAVYGENSQEVARLESRLRSSQITEAQLANAIADTTRELNEVRGAEAQRNSSVAEAERRLGQLKETEEELKGATSRLTAEHELQRAQLSKNATESEKLRLKMQQLSEEQDQARRATQNYEQQLEQAKRQYGENSAELNRFEQQLAEARTAEIRLANEITQTTRELAQQESRLREVGTQMGKIGEKIQGIGKGFTQNISVPLAAIGIGAGLAAKNFEDSTVRIQTSLGATSEEAEKLTKASRDIYKKGFGESAGEIDEALIQTRQNIRSLNNEDLGAITKKALILSQTFDADVNEVTRAANNLMKGFGIEADEAFDLMASGAQNGLNFSNELFDNLAEYSTLFGNMGFSAGEYFQLLSQGMEAGAYNLDYINDVMKEFQIRVKDGSKASTDAMAQLSKETNAVWKSFLKGEATVKDVSNAVLAELEGMDNQVKANEIGVGLYGTKWEDLESDAMYALGGIGGGLKDVDGTMDGMIDTIENSFGARFQSILRNAQSSLLPLGETLLDLADDYLPKVEAGVKNVNEWFSNLSPSTQDFIVKAGLLVAALGPVLAIVGTIATGVGSLITAFSTATIVIGGAGGFGAVLASVATGPVGIAIGAVAALSIGILAVNEASKSNVVETQKAIEKRREELDSLDATIGRYEELQNKNKLSTDEVLRYMDIMTELKDAKNEDTIAALTAEQEALLEKSGLTNDEFSEFLSLNGQLLESAPAAASAISEQGNAYLDVLDAVKELSAAERQRLTDQTYESIRSEMQAQEDNLKRQKKLHDEIRSQESERNGLLNERTKISEGIRQQDLLIADLGRQMIGNSEEENLLLMEQITKEQEIKWELEGQLRNHDSQIDRLDTQIGKKQKSLEETNKELSAYDLLLDDYASMILSEQGIVAEKGKAVEKIKQEQREIDTAKKKLDEQFRKQQIGTGEYETQNQKLREQQNRIDTAKKKLEEVNTVAGRTVYKTVNIKENPASFWKTLDRNLGRSVSKLVNVDYSVRRSLNLAPVAPLYAEGTNNHPGGYAILGDGKGSNAGPELFSTRSGQVGLSPAEPTLFNLPSGSAVLSATKTRRTLSEMISNQINKTMQEGVLQGVRQPISISPAPIYLDGGMIAEVIFPMIDARTGDTIALNNQMRGRSW